MDNKLCPTCECDMYPEYVANTIHWVCECCNHQIPLTDAEIDELEMEISEEQALEYEEREMIKNMDPEDLMYF